MHMVHNIFIFSLQLHGITALKKQEKNKKNCASEYDVNT